MAASAAMTEKGASIVYAHAVGTKTNALVAALEFDCTSARYFPFVILDATSIASRFGNPA